MGAAIIVDGVSKRFRLYHERNQSLKATILRRGRAKFEEFSALDAVSLEIDTGETFGFIGENGSGKSTLLKCIAKILRPDVGSISVEGKVSALLELGAGFHPELSGRENVYLNGSILGLSKRELDDRFDEIVEFAGLERFIDTPVKSYSSGMYVRLGFSVAINVDPEVLLVDEVLAVGDEMFQRKCAEKFVELKEAGKTIVLVSHGLGSVRTMCDRVLWLDHGRPRAIGGAADVIDSYLDSVHHAVPDHDGGTQWGTGEARINAVDLFTADGTPTTSFRSGDPMMIRLRWRSEVAVPKPVFQVVISTVEGTVVSAPTSRDFGFYVDELSPSGGIEVTIPELVLLPGSYEVSIGLFDRTTAHQFHSWHRAARFDVLAGSNHESYPGIVSLSPKWQLVDQSGTA